MIDHLDIGDEVDLECVSCRQDRCEVISLGDDYATLLCAHCGVAFEVEEWVL